MRLTPIFCLSFIFAWSFVHGQSHGIIRGLTKDSAKGTALAFATISVYDATDTSLITFRLSDQQGNFKLTGLPLDRSFHLVISYSGYASFKKDLRLTKDNTALDLGEVFINPSATLLDNVTVFAETPPVVVRNDTIEFNASSFKTLPNALVEDLLKKLPGVHVDKSGSITVNGKAVSRILVDGKQFFGSDVTIATKNLPADIIDKVQVVNDQDELDENIFKHKETADKVINLTLKRSIKKGCFGKLYGGFGTDKRYEAGGIVNNFRDTLQVSLIGFSNNINHPGFNLTEIKDIGGFGRSGYSSSSFSSAGGFSLNGISFGATSEGVQTSSGGGINISTELSKKISLNAQYFIGNIKSDLDKTVNNQQSLNDTVLTMRSTSRQRTNDLSQRMALTFKWRINKLATLNIVPALTIGSNAQTVNYNTTTSSNFDGFLNQIKSDQASESSNARNDDNISYRQNFNKPRRVFTANLITGITTSRENRFFKSSSFFYSGQTPEDSLDQLRSRRTPRSRYSLTLSYAEPLSKSVALQFSNQTVRAVTTDGISTFDPDQTHMAYSVVDSSLTDELKRHLFEDIFSAGLNIHLKQLVLQPTISFETISTDDHFLIASSLRKRYHYILPQFVMSWKGMYLNYVPRIIEPMIYEIHPIVDNTNPLLLHLGNPDLKPYLAHTIYLLYNHYDTKKSISYDFVLSGMLNKNAVAQKRTVSGDGVQSIVPVNVNGVRGYSASFRMTKDWKTYNHFYASLTGNLHVSQNRIRVLVNETKAFLNLIELNPSVHYSLNWHDMFEFDQEYILMMDRGHYSQNAFENTTIVSHQLTSELVFRKIKNTVLETSIDYYYNPVTAQGIDNETFRWNAAVHFLFLKGQKADLKITIYDLLNQNRDIIRSIRENIITDVQQTTLRRFIMLTFIYNLKEVKGNVGKRERLVPF